MEELKNSNFENNYIEEKIKQYKKYQNRIDRIIKNVSADGVLNDKERARFVGFLNSSRYHCQGRINKLNEYEKENLDVSSNN
jgi:flagellar biosynthesis chaperone FliJ